MIETLKILQICDHYVAEKTESFVVATARKNTTTTDSIDLMPNEVIKDIYSVYDASNNFYYENYHFTKTSNQILWTTAYHPTNNTYYTVEFLKLKTDITQYEQEFCPKCNGNGWYTDIYNGNGTTMSKVTGSDKVTQEFVRIMLSDNLSNSFNSTIGAADYGNNIQKISDFITECESLFMQNQDLIAKNSNLTLDDSETLKGILIDDISYEKDMTAYFVSVRLVMKSGEVVDIGLKL